MVTGLPILSFLQFLGGVDPDLVLASFAVVGLSVVGLASVGILNSVVYRRPRDAIAMTYLMAIGYIAIATVPFLFKFGGLGSSRSRSRSSRGSPQIRPPSATRSIGSTRATSSPS